jgi:hypothetical protein
MENLIVSGSNFPCFYPLYLTYQNNDYFTFIPLLIVSFGSIFSHLVENHKHCMSGIGFSTKVSYYLNRLDVFGCVLVISRFGYLIFEYGIMAFLTNNKILTFACFLSFMLNIISEHDKKSKTWKPYYILTHSLWHLTIFPLMGIAYTVINQHINNKTFR